MVCSGPVAVPLGAAFPVLPSWAEARGGKGSCGSVVPAALPPPAALAAPALATPSVCPSPSVRPCYREPACAITGRSSRAWGASGRTQRCECGAGCSSQPLVEAAKPVLGLTRSNGPAVVCLKRCREQPLRSVEGRFRLPGGGLQFPVSSGLSVLVGCAAGRPALRLRSWGCSSPGRWPGRPAGRRTPSSSTTSTVSKERGPAGSVAGGVR